MGARIVSTIRAPFFISDRRRGTAARPEWETRADDPPSPSRHHYNLKGNFQMKRTLIFTSMAFLLLSCPALAQNPGSGGGEALDTVVVTASRSAETLREVSQSMVVITQKEIRESAIDNPLDLLKKYGLQIAHQDAPEYGGSMLRMRGVSTSNHGIDLSGQILVLIDGRRTGTDNFSILDMNSIARIEVIRGPGAMQYGSSAVGGVVNVITERGARKTDVKLETGIGSFGAKTYKGFASGRVDRFDYALGASYYSVDDYDDGKGKRNHNSGLDARRKYAANLGWNIDDDNRIGLALQQAETDRAGIGESPAAASRALQTKDSGYHALDLSYEGGTRQHDKNWSLRYFTGKSDYELTRTSNVAATLGQRQPYSGYENQFQGAQGTFSFEAERFSLVTGVDYLDYDVDQDQYFSAYTNLKNMNFTHGKYTNIGAFAIGKAHLLDKHNLTLSAGLRYDTFKSEMDTRYNFDAGPYTLDLGSKYKKFLPSVGLAYHPLDSLKLRVNYGHAFKMPSPREQGGAFYMSTTLFIGNPDIKPEESKTWDIGLDFNHRALNAFVTYFDTSYKNKIEALPRNPALDNARVYDNLAKADMRGIEAGASFDLGRHLDWGFNFEPYFALTRMTRYEDNTGTKIPEIAKNSASFGLRFNHPAWKLSSTLDCVYYGPRADYEDTHGGSTVADLRIAKNIARLGNNGDLKLRVSVNNLFDKYYRHAPATSGFPYLPGRSFYVGLVYDID
jgi:vitamin B12 transporter